MTDRTPEQINHNIDQTLAICAETSRNLTQLEVLVKDFIASAKPRLLGLETSREQDEDRLEELENNRVRMERAHLEHQERMNSMERAHLEHQERMNNLERAHLEHQERMNSMERAHLEHQERMDNMAAAAEQSRLDHQARIDRQDRIIELLTRQTGTKFGLHHRIVMLQTPNSRDVPVTDNWWRSTENWGFGVGTSAVIAGGKG
jgi:hypothetical protein